MPDLTISDLKRALGEVKRMCATRGRCKEPDICPFYCDKRGDCTLNHHYAENWDTDDWKEDFDENA